MEYVCTIKIDVDTPNPQAAAQAAFALLHHPDCFPWIVDVADSSGKETRIDLASNSKLED